MALLAQMVETEYREFPELRASQAGAGYRAAKATAAERERLDLRDSMEIRYQGARSLSAACMIAQCHGLQPHSNRMMTKQLSTTE